MKCKKKREEKKSHGVSFIIYLSLPIATKRASFILIGQFVTSHQIAGYRRIQTLINS